MVTQKRYFVATVAEDFRPGGQLFGNTNSLLLATRYAKSKSKFYAHARVGVFAQPQGMYLKSYIGGKRW